MATVARLKAAFFGMPFVLLYCLNPTEAYAERSKPTPQLLEIGISMSIPPWVMKDTNSGIELDILYAALDSDAYIVKPNYLPFAMAFNLFDEGKLDGIINAKEGVTRTGYFSEPVVEFQNVAVSLAHKAYPANIDVDFLGNKSVVAFQKASSLLGARFGRMAEQNPDYQEIAKQNLQINLLFIRNTDFVVMDKSIFGYYWFRAVNEQTNPELRARYFKPVQFHYIFEPTHYPFVFKSEAVRDAFNQGLTRLKLTGQYGEILNKYDKLTNLYERAKQHHKDDSVTLSPST